LGLLGLGLGLTLTLTLTQALTLREHVRVRLDVGGELHALGHLERCRQMWRRYRGAVREL